MFSGSVAVDVVDVVNDDDVVVVVVSVAIISLLAIRKVI